MSFKPIASTRYFSATEKYDEINWGDFTEVIKRFRYRIEGWYIEPIHSLKNSSHNYNFAVMALNCLLIDALSQYYYGKLRSSNKVFKTFIKEAIPEFRQRLPNPIKVSFNNLEYLEDAADVLYHGYRCGILHEAHIPLYGGIAGANGKVFEIHDSGHVLYEDGTDCTSLIIEPYKLTLKIEQFFSDYIDRLLDNDVRYDSLRVFFRKKFANSFGVNI